MLCEFDYAEINDNNRSKQLPNRLDVSQGFQSPNVVKISFCNVEDDDSCGINDSCTLHDRNIEINVINIGLGFDHFECLINNGGTTNPSYNSYDYSLIKQVMIHQMLKKKFVNYPQERQYRFQHQHQQIYQVFVLLSVQQRNLQIKPLIDNQHPKPKQTEKLASIMAAEHPVVLVKGLVCWKMEPTIHYQNQHHKMHQVQDHKMIGMMANDTCSTITNINCSIITTI